MQISFILLWEKLQSEYKMLSCVDYPSTYTFGSHISEASVTNLYDKMKQVSPDIFKALSLLIISVW